MADRLSVDREALSSSATQVQGHGDDLAVGHTATTRAVAAAGGGWAGESSSALAAWSARFADRSGAIVDRIGEHSQHMHSAVHRYSTNEQQRAAEMNDVDDAGRQAARDA